MEDLKFTLVTTCWNEKDAASSWLISIKNQSKIPDEIIIVDNFSNDGTSEIILDFISKEKSLNIRLLKKKCNVAQGRNYAISNAHFPFIVSTDMGLKIPDNWFYMITRPFYESPAEVVIGDHKYDHDSISNIWAKCEYFLFDRGVHLLDEKFIPSNRNIAYSLNVWEALSGYPEDLTLAGDDTVFGLQLINSNFKIYHAAEAIVYWSMHNTLKKFLKQNYIYGIGNGEADIDRSLIRKLYFIRIPLKCTFYSFMSLATLPKIILNLLKEREIFLPIVMIIYRFLCSYYYSKGYFKGMSTGLYRCVSARNRTLNIYSRK